MKARVVSLFLLAFLMGCTRMVWVKNGATIGEFEQMKAACLLEGVDKVPYNTGLMLITEAPDTSYADCDDVRDCRRRRDDKPRNYEIYDQNKSLREQVVRACFYRNGWNMVELKDGEKPNP
jgi:hypothetical protein